MMLKELLRLMAYALAYVMYRTICVMDSVIAVWAQVLLMFSVANETVEMNRRNNGNETSCLQSG